MKLPRSGLSSPCQAYYSDDDFDLYPPTGKRLAPVGAASDEQSMTSCQDGLVSDAEAQLAGGSDCSAGGGGGLAGILTTDGGPFAAHGASNNHLLEERLRQMEEDQEELNTSLMSLTSHFAKVVEIHSEK